ncbi:EcKinase 14 [Hyalella azteca]|uniref:EcKinase 14 n=1 Tax=Hyalella azteca TaxID=294128 RepID=A0A6A0HEB6_HYAAZ|nr:uncharacterized protein LOC108680042 [Hyalella azteca]KAA0202977.1 EcKinase 14 [Hyalella azteca]
MTQDDEFEYDFICSTDVITALTEAVGSEAKFQSYEVRDFIKKGDNYLGTLTSILVVYNLDAETKEISFIVKAARNQSSSLSSFSEYLYMKEFDFYSKVIPALNKELKSIGQHTLQIPKCYLCVEKESLKVLFLEDLRCGGFKLYNRKTSLDMEHLSLVCRELAHLHAISNLYLTKNNYKAEDIRKIWPCLKDPFYIFKEEGDLASFEDFFKTFICTGIVAATSNPGYEGAAKFFKECLTTAHEIFYDQMLLSSQEFTSICHGDAWTNNFLFRYDNAGKAVECKFLDFQFNRVGSLALDLNYLFYSSLDEGIRKQNLDSVLSVYQSSYECVLKAAGSNSKLTLNQLKDEFKSKQKFGLISGLMMIPMVNEDSDDVFDVDIFIKKKTDSENRMLEEIMRKKFETNRTLNTMTLQMIDEMIEAGVIKN